MNIAADTVNEIAKNSEAPMPKCASRTRLIASTLTVVIAHSVATPTAMPASAPAAARPRVVGPASRSSHRPVSSSPRSILVEVRIPHTAPTMTRTASVRHAVKPATVPISCGTPKSAWSPAFDPSDCASVARDAAVGYVEMKPSTDATT